MSHILRHRSLPRDKLLNCNHPSLVHDIPSRGAGVIRSTRGAAGGEGRRRAASDRGPPSERRSRDGKAANPKTADDLDKELDAYVTTGGAKGSEDIDMAA